MSGEAKENIRKILKVLDEYCDSQDDCKFCVFRENNNNCKLILDVLVGSYVELMEENCENNS